MPPESGDAAKPVGSAVRVSASLLWALIWQGKVRGYWRPSLASLVRPNELFLSDGLLTRLPFRLVDASICSAKLGLCGSTSDSLGRRRLRLEKTIVFCPSSTQTTAAEEAPLIDK